jgi:nucleoside transporter
LSDAARQYPTIRVLGTVGWIAVGLLIGILPGSAATALPLQLGGGAGLLLALYAFSLPRTPPKARHEPFKISTILGLDLLARIRNRNFWVFAGSVLLIMIPLSFYYAYCNNFLIEAGASIDAFGIHIEPAAIQTLGQGAEFVFMLLLPLLLIRFGIRGVLLMGMLAWTLRYALFAFGFDAAAGGKALLIAGVLLHGVSYDFFFVASQLYIDKCFDAAARSRAQAFLVTLNMGLGVLLGANLANVIYTANTVSASIHHWRVIWLIPAGIAFVVALLFGLLFRVEADPVPIPA